MKRILPILLAMLLLAACGDKEAPSSQKEPSPGGGPVSSQPKDDPGDPAPDPGSHPDGDVDPSGGEGEDPEPEKDLEEGLSGGFVTPLTDIDGNELGGTVSFSVEFPDNWTASGNLIYDNEGWQVAEILSSIAFKDDGVFEQLAKQYPDSDPIPVTVGGLSGFCFYDEIPMEGPDYPTGFKSEIVYFLVRKGELFCMRYFPLYSVGVGAQREDFQAQIKEIR